MAKVAYSAVIEGLRGKAGTAVFIEGVSGPTARRAAIGACLAARRCDIISREERNHDRFA